LPADGVYYLLVSDAAEDDFAGQTGSYSLTVAADAAIGALVAQADNAPDDQVPAPKTAAAPESAAPAGISTAEATGPGSVSKAAGAPAPPASTAVRSTAVTGRPKASKPAPPSATVPPADSGTPLGVFLGTVARESGGPRPEAVFRTLPRASATNRITGDALFDVTFDLCASTTGAPARDLTFTYDFDGDGTVDDSGHCRQTHAYQFDGSGPRCITSVACVGDGQQGHDTCRNYAICGGERTPVRP
jgi:hypothetical protein